MRVGSLFSGIGGLDLGLERAGMEIAWQVEIDPWCRKVLEKHWPNVPKYGDVRELTGAELEPVDLIAGGFPCQPVSCAGRREGQADPRWLWPEFIRIVSALRPRLVFVENVPGLLQRGMAELIGSLSSCGYDAEWDCIPAAAVGAPHLRYRVFIVAYSVSRTSGRQRRVFVHPDGQGRQRPEARRENLQPKGRQTHHPDIEPSSEAMAYAQRNTGQDGQAPSKRQGRSSGSSAVAYPTGGSNRAEIIGQKADGQDTPRPAGGAGRPSWWAIEPNVGRVAHGVPSRVDRLRGLGNAVVPQVAEWIGRRIMESAKC